MPASALDARSALILVDLQEDVTALPTVDPADDVVANAARLMTAFHDAGLPVALVRVATSTDGGDARRARADHPLPPPPADTTLDRRLPVAEGDIHVVKRGWGAFHGTELDLQLRRRGVTGVVLGGIATSLGVESTARAAHDHGYDITFATDAMTDISAEAAQNSATRIFPFLGELDATDAVLALLGR
ncbi:isochorismatase family protein [Actinomycetospora sp. C-140]